jgi:hypothetical protein
MTDWLHRVDEDARRRAVRMIAALLLPLLASCRAPAPVDSSRASVLESQREVERTLRELLAAAERKDFVKLEAFHLYEPRFSKWDTRGAVRMDAEASRREERVGIESLEAFRPGVEDLKVDVFGDTAVATFLMPYEVVAAGQTSRNRVRATLVWHRVDSGWKVVHEHFSPLPPSPPPR